MSSTSSTTSLTQGYGWRSQYSIYFSQLRKNPLTIVGIAIVLLWIAVIIFAQQIATHDPIKQDLVSRLQPPNGEHLFGTDELGRDIFSRVVYGSRITIPAGFAVILFGAIVGITIGSIAGYLGGAGDETLMRFTELFMAFPTIILAMAITAALGPAIENAIFALVIVWWPTYARVMRGLVLEVKSQEYVDAARTVGAPGRYILSRTILPNCVAPALVLATLDIGNAIIVFASLSFIGLGPEPTSPEWGRMVSLGIDFFDQWWMWLFPGLAIASLVMALNFIGDGMRDILDPRVRK